VTLPKDYLLHDRYLIRNLLRQSGMGAVYLADDVVLKVTVAVKENNYTTPDHSRQFRKEATILARLRHPALPRVIDHFILEDLGEYLVMDYIPGDDLREHLAKIGRPLTLAETMAVAIPVCDALDYLHACKPPIVHRDVKPANIKLSQDGSVHLVDFGLAKEYQAGEMTSTGAQGITPGYSPVEQYAHGTEMRSDIYALGATLYTALSGRQPLDALERAMGSDQIVPLKALNRGVPADIAGVIEKAMSLKLEDRFSSVVEFKQALLSAFSLTQPVSVPGGVSLNSQNAVQDKAKPGQPTGKHKKKGRWLIWVIPLLVVVMALAVGVPLMLRAIKPTIEPTGVAIATSQLIVKQPTDTLQPTATNTDLPVVLPENTIEPTATRAPATQEPAPTETQPPIAQLAFTSERDGGVPQVWLVNADGSGLLQMTDEKDGACQPAWSPDGSKLVYITPCAGKMERYAGASLVMLDLPTRRTDVISQFRTGDYDPDWSPDGLKIAFTSLQTGKPQVHVYDIASRSITRLMNRATESRQPAWSTDGTQIAFVAPDPLTNQPQVWLISSDGSGDPRLLKEGIWKMMLHPDWKPGGNTIIFDLGTGSGLATYAPGGQPMDLDLGVKMPQDPAYSSNLGAWIAFSGQSQAGNSEIYLLQSDVGVQVVAADPADDFHPTWKP